MSDFKLGYITSCQLVNCHTLVICFAITILDNICMHLIANDMYSLIRSDQFLDDLIGLWLINPVRMWLIWTKTFRSVFCCSNDGSVIILLNLHYSAVYLSIMRSWVNFPNIKRAFLMTSWKWLNAKTSANDINANSPVSSYSKLLFEFQSTLLLYYMRGADVSIGINSVKYAASRIFWSKTLLFLEITILHAGRN